MILEVVRTEKALRVFGRARFLDYSYFSRLISPPDDFGVCSVHVVGKALKHTARAVTVGSWAVIIY